MDVAVLALLVLAAVIAFPIYALVRLAELSRAVGDLRRELRRITSQAQDSGAAARAPVVPSHLTGSPEAPPAPAPPSPGAITARLEPAAAPPEARVIPEASALSVAPGPPVIPPPPPVPSAAPQVQGSEAAPELPRPRPIRPLPVASSGASPPPAPPPPAVTAPMPRPDLESILGANWLSKLGVAAIAIATAFFLNYAFTHQWIGPAGRVAIGLVGSSIMLGLGQVLLNKPIYRTYAQVLSSGGIIVLFLSIYAAYSLYHLIGFTAAFGVLAVAAIAASALAVANNTEGVALLCIAGAFATPVLIRQGGEGAGDLLRLYAYIAGLNLWSAVLARRRRWDSLIALAFGATWVIFFGAGHLHSRNYLVVEAFAAAFLFFACYHGMAQVRAEPKPAEEAPATQWWGMGLIVIGCLAFVIASVLILEDVAALGLPAIAAIGAAVALLLAGLAAAMPDAGAYGPARQSLRYLSAVAVAALVGISVATAPTVSRDQAFGGFLFGLLTYLMFLGVAVHMRRAGEPEAPAIFLLAVNAIVHLMVAFHALAPVRIWGIHAAPLWLPLAGGMTLGALPLIVRQRHEGRGLPLAVMIAAQALPLIAFLAALDMSGRWAAGRGAGLFLGEFVLVSATWIALRGLTAQPRFRGDLLGAFGNAFIFLGLLAATLRLQAYEGFVLLCGCAIALAAYHAVVGAVVLRPPRDDLLRRFVYLGLALTFITIAIPLQLRASYITVAWAVEGAVLVWTGLAVGDRRVRWYGIILLGITALKALALDVGSVPGHFRFLLNPRMLSGASVIAAAYASAWLLSRRRDALSVQERTVPAALAALANAFTLIFVSLDLWDFAWRAGGSLGRSNAQQLALTLFWSLYAVALLRTGLAIGDARVRWCGLALLGAAGLKSFLVDMPIGLAHFHPLLNPRLLSGASVVAASYVSAWWLWRRRDAISSEERIAPRVLVLAANLFTLVFVSLDLWEYVGLNAAVDVRESARQLALSIFWSVYALGMMSVGIWKRTRPVRLFAMGLLYLSIFKVFLFDLSSLQQFYRILSLFGLGVVLLVVSLLYTRFEERLR